MTLNDIDIEFDKIFVELCDIQFKISNTTNKKKLSKLNKEYDHIREKVLYFNNKRQILYRNIERKEKMMMINND